MSKWKFLIFLFLVCSKPQAGFTQDADSIVKPDPQFGFSWSQKRKDKSLQPYYDALKTAEFGTQRFSIFEQLIAFHTQKASTDSILHYGNLYVQEIGNWDKPEDEKKSYLAKAYYFMSVGSQLNGLTDKSIEWNIKGLQEAEKGNSTEYQYLHKIGLSKNYLAQKNPDKAIKILNTAIADYSNEYSEITNKALVVLGNVHLYKKEYTKANEQYQKSIELARKFKDLEMEYSIVLQQAKLLEAQNKKEEALDAYMNVSAKALDKGFNAVYYEGSLLVGKLFYKLEDYQAANMGLSTAYINAVDHGNLQFQKEALSINARSFAKQEDYYNSYAVMTHLFGVLQDIKEKQQREIIKELEIQYETSKRKQEISGLKEDQLMKNAELKRQKTIKYAFLIGFLVILIPVFALLYTYYQKIQAQSELAKKQEEINIQKVTSLQQEQELKLIKASIEGQDEERKRIAQELHDSIGGNLAGIKLQLASIGNDTKTLGGISSQLDETYQLVRDLSHTLIPKKFRQNEFVQLVEEYVKSISNTGKIEVDFHPHPEEKINTLEDSMQMELFKIIQELMTNTLKHANAKRADINLNCFDDSITLLFEDNGVGFDTSKNADGIGYQNLKNRANKLNGELHVDSAPNRGTVVSLEIPLNNNTI